ncbi:biotin--[acetyl-CoA-carboxylase] ligase [Silanimonas sp.]|jgi:BirA family biotin operon repressor/biotin-[acetyl-CoA-carboxylase] ligase|uniref:biotin--[acetyl-CoA-carboxylase] ligase n=1 Tax=Silanimonas sp. TaxID=1929290 RepID=UPI0022CB5551|nr:biotin--[acetyl-CoA-carboxylase] ligase [Silanimonas sp.]MCZ8114174.1 biotin--[acetyl-CoA-carboxylase] ligase [Silanimonas sp.]
MPEAFGERDLALDEATLGELAGLHHADAVDSTQDWALRSPLPARGAAVFVADRQSAGRGRRGRAWQTDPEGALAFTVLRRFALPPMRLAPLGPAVGVAVARALHEAGASALRLKWPNDLVVDDAKLAGLLIEARGEAVAIGIGLNLAVDAVPGVEQPWTDLRRAGVADVARPRILGVVLRALLPALAEFEREGFAAFAGDWARFDALAGRPVRVLAGERVEDGVAIGIDAGGGLRVRHADGDRVHYAGEVSVRVAA